MDREFGFNMSNGGGDILGTFDPSRPQNQLFSKFEEACLYFRSAKSVTEKKVNITNSN